MGTGSASTRAARVGADRETVRVPPGGVGDATLNTAQSWTNMSGNSWRNARFLEYRNTGPGVGVNSNLPQLPDSQATDCTPQKYLAGTDGWNPL